jgi:flagellar assembly protein FliH
MNCLLNPVQFNRPLREVRLSGAVPSVDSACARQGQEEEAFERGRREGEKALSEQLLRQRSELQQLQQGVLQSLRDVLPQIARECENTLIALALESAQKLVAGLPISAEVVEATVREALARVEATSELTVHLHAEDLEILRRANSPLLLSDVAGARLRFQANREVSQGGCIVQTRFGTIDARRETKLELLRKALEVS